MSLGLPINYISTYQFSVEEEYRQMVSEQEVHEFSAAPDTREW